MESAVPAIKRPRAVALILPPVPAYSRELTEGVIARRFTKHPWRLVDLPHLRIGDSPLPAAGVELDGAIVWADRRDHWIEDLVARGVKVVNCGSDWLGVAGVVSVRARLSETGAILTGHFKDLGLQQLVMVGHLLKKRPVMRKMLEEFVVTAAKAGIVARVWDIGGGEDPSDSPKRLFEPEKEHHLADFLRDLSTPTGIFCENDHIAVIVCRVASLLGLRVPEDLAVMGYGDNLVARFSEPPLTSIAPPGQAIGRLAATTLARWMETGEMPAADQVMGGMALTPRESTVGPSGSLELERIRRRIATLAARGITVTDLVTSSGLSIKTFVRRYTEAFGIEPAEELRQLRLGEAKRLLMETDQSVSEIATALGFTSQASFYNYFMRHTKTCPSEFRRAGTSSPRGGP